MADDEVWRLPGAVRGGDVRLRGSGASALSPAAAARLRRIVRRVPEAMVKVTGRTRGGAAALKAHLDYVTRNGRLQAETSDGTVIAGRAELRALYDDWMLANAAQARGRSGPSAAQSVGLILSMPPGTPPDRVAEAARAWARETFAGTHDWLLVRHDDTGHPHVHVTVRAVGADGRRLAPGPKDLQAWRERFARELRRLGVEAEATPRQARGVVRKAPKAAVQRLGERGVEPCVRAAERREAEREARAPAASVPAWSRRIQARQEAIRRAYLGHAETLEQGDAAERELARDIRRFVAEMPVPLTRRQAMAVELGRVLEQHPGRGDAAQPGRTEEPAPGLRRATPDNLTTPQQAEVPQHRR